VKGQSIASIGPLETDSRFLERFESASSLSNMDFESQVGESQISRDSSLEQVGELARRVNGLLDGDPGLEEFADLVTQAERIAASSANETSPTEGR